LFIEFTYNRSVNSTINHSISKIIYGFNPLTSLNLLSLPVNEMVNLDKNKKVEMAKKLYECLKTNKKNEQYVSRTNKGYKHIIFELDDWVWMHMRKEKFLDHRKSKLHSRGYGTFQVIEQINDNAYKLKLLSEYNVSATFNILIVFLLLCR